MLIPCVAMSSVRDWNGMIGALCSGGMVVFLLWHEMMFEFGCLHAPSFDLFVLVLRPKWWQHRVTNEQSMKNDHLLNEECPYQKETPNTRHVEIGRH